MTKVKFGEYIEESVQRLLHQKSLVDRIPPGIPLKIQFLGHICESRGNYTNKTLFGVVQLNTINKECFSFKWYAVDLPVHEGELTGLVDRNSGQLGSHGWKHKEPNPYGSLSFEDVLSCVPFEGREAPLLMGWRYKSCAFKELFR
jgi:hypothetical protein